MEQDHLKTADGCKIAFQFHHEAGKPTLILSPSLGTAMSLFDPQMDDLSQHFSILRYDPRGHGESDVPTGSYSLDRLGRDVVELMDHLTITRAHFCGVSLGGMTGQWLGYRVPERLNRLVLANTSAFMGPPLGWDERIASVREQGMSAMVELVIARWFTPEFVASHPDAVVPIKALLSATDPMGYAGCSAAIRDMDMRPILPLIAAKTLVISGTKDPATPVEHGEFLANSIPNGDLFAIEAAHLSNVEKARTFNEKVMAFLLAN